MDTKKQKQEPLSDFTIDDLEKSVGEDKGKAITPTPTVEEKFNFTIRERYGTLSMRKNSPLFSLVNWSGAERYDLRHWQDNGAPGKGITFTKKELEELHCALEDFDFSVEYERPIRRYNAGKMHATFYCLIKMLSVSYSNEITWNKEVNILDWGYGQKVDFRKWSEDYDRCSKGICIDFDELKELKRLIATVL